MNDPLIRYTLAQAQQRERWHEADQARQARTTIPDRVGLVEQMETAPDLTGLVERVIQHVWKRLGLPARELGFRPVGGQSARPSRKLGQTHLQDVSL